MIFPSSTLSVSFGGSHPIASGSLVFVPRSHPFGIIVSLDEGLVEADIGWLFALFVIAKGCSAPEFLSLGTPQLDVLFVSGGSGGHLSSQGCIGKPLSAICCAFVESVMTLLLRIVSWLSLSLLLELCLINLTVSHFFFATSA